MMIAATMIAAPTGICQSRKVSGTAAKAAKAARQCRHTHHPASELK
jgi:hypothetical protein